jgi:hypothetical protein
VNTVSTRRNSSQALNPNIKSLNYLNNIFAKIEAGVSGAREAIMLSLEGYVAECTGDNIFYVKGKRLVTPPSVGGGAGRHHPRGGDGIWPRRWGWSRKRNCLPLLSLYTADEVFLTGTAAEVIPVVKIDARPIGDGKPGPQTRRLIDSVPRNSPRRDGGNLARIFLKGTFAVDLALDKKKPWTGWEKALELGKTTFLWRTYVKSIYRTCPAGDSDRPRRSETA